jgi:hypothetical protein
MRSLGLLLAAVGLLGAGCGTSSSTATASSGPVTPPHITVKLISMTAAGGQPSRTASPLDTPAEVTAFSQQFRTPAMENRIRALTAHVDTEDVVSGTVVTVGCDRPPGATATVADSGAVTIVPAEVASPLPECLAPVTTVAIAIMPRS